MITDTHTHLYLPEFKSEIDALLRKANASGVKKFLLPNIDSSSIEDMLALEAKYPENCFAMMGLHPCSVDANVDKELAIVHEWLQKRRFIGVGEIGLDLYWEKAFFQQQVHAFRTQMEWALDDDYAVSIHCRSAYNELYTELKAMDRLPRSVFHCFSGTLQEAEQILALGNFKLGIGGVVTFKNGGLDNVVEHIGLEHLVLETDAPYLAPVPFRGKRNEPAHILEVAKKVAQLKNCSLEQVSEITSRNAAEIFKN